MDTSSIDYKDRVLGCFLGGAIGDALGYQCEFERGIKEREFKTFADDYGIFSDDTQMMLFTANALLWGQTRAAAKGIAPTPIDCINLAYRDWYCTQNELPPESANVSWIDKVPAMRHRRAPGFTCLNATAITNAPEKHGTIKQPVNQSKGCGCTMRVAPIGLFAKNLKEAVELGADSAALTHGHPLGIISTAFLAGLIYEIAHDTNRKFSEQLHLAFEYTNQFATLQFHRQYQQDFTKIMRKAFELSRNNFHDQANINELGQGWVAEEAVAIAVYCCLRHQDDFDDAVIASVNHDGDSDSTGVIAGNIMGARLGVAAIPPYYLDHIEHRNLIQELATDFAEGAPKDIDSLPEDSPWIVKYIHLKPVKEYD